MKKRVVCVLAALLAMSMALSACGGGAAPAANPGEEAAAPAGESAAATPVAGDGVNSDELMEITVAIRGTGFTQDGSKIQKYYEDKYNVKFNFIVIPAPPDGNAKCNLLMSDPSQRPDVMWWLAMDLDYAKWKDAGLLVDLAAYYEKYPNIREYYETVSPDTMFFAQESDGRLFRIPGDVSEPGTYTTFLRQDWMDNLGITTVPTTLEEYTDVLRKMTFDDPDGNGEDDTYGFGGQGIDYTSFQPFWSAFEAIPGNTNAEFIRKDGKIVYAATQPEMKEAVAYIQSLYLEGLIDPVMMTQNDFNNEYVNGGIGSWYRWAAWMNKNNSVYDGFVANNPTGNFVAIEAIKSPSGYASDIPGQAKGWSHFGITDVAEDPERIYMIFDDMVEPETWKIRQFGFEGEEYVIEDGIYRNLLVGDDNVNKNIGTNLFRDYVNRKDAANIANKPEVIELFDKRAETSRAEYARTAYFKSVDRPEWQKYGADLNKLRDEYLWGIMGGARPIEDFDAFVELFYSSGGTEVEAEATEFMAIQDAEYAEYIQ